MPGPGFGTATRRFLVALLSAVALGSSQTGAAAPDEPATLLYLENTLPSCSGVSKVQRTDVKFRIYTDSPQLYYEFNVADLKASDGSYGMVFLDCATGSCISVHAAIEGEWQKLTQTTGHGLQCGSESAKIADAIAHFLKSFGSNSIEFPAQASTKLSVLSTAPPSFVVREQITKKESSALKLFLAAATNQLTVNECAKRGSSSTALAQVALNSMIDKYADRIIRGKAVYEAGLTKQTYQTLSGSLVDLQSELSSDSDAKVQSRCELLTFRINDMLKQ